MISSVVMGIESKSEEILAIQVLRAVAALSVCTVHFEWLTLALLGRKEETLATDALGTGVDLFFVISGFVMVYSSESLFAQPAARWIFLWRRLVRIAPLYWLVTFVSLYTLNTPFDFERLFKSILFIPYRGPSGEIVPLYGIGWSLNAEMYFYAVFAAAIVFKREVAASLVGAIIASGVVAGFAFGNALPPALRFWSDPIVLEFLVGMGLAILYRRGMRLPWPAGILLCLAGTAAILFANPKLPPSGMRWLFCGVPAAAIFAGLVFQPSLPKILKSVGKLGDASYAIYLLHPLAAFVLKYWAVGLNQFPIEAVIPTLALGTIAVALFVYKYFERPTTRALRSFPEAAFRRAQRATT